MKLILSAWLIWVAVFFTSNLSVYAQVAITYPASRAIFQRDLSDRSPISITGTYSQPVTRVEARLVVMNAGQGINTDWTTIQNNPQGGIFQGTLTGRGGWYRLEVRGWNGTALVGENAVDRIGVGEVFIITGQSNAQGFQDKGAAGASDDRVNTITYDNSKSHSLNDPPAPTFRQLGADALVGPRGESAWCWGILGDLIAQQYNVPVLFINTAWAGTTIRAWVQSANGEPAQNIFAIGTPEEFYPKGMPYGNLVVALRYYSSLLGLRAVLWQQGETDNVPLRLGRQQYREYMQYLVNKTRADTKRYPAWVLARSSYNLGETSANVIGAQNDVINTFNNNVYAGPMTDGIQIPRPDGVHFGGDGLRQLAQAWFASMDARFFSSSIPLLPLPAAGMTVSCPTNQALTLNLAGSVKDQFDQTYNFQDITWSNGQKGPSITVSAPGKYFAIAKDEKNTTFLSPTVTISGALQPAAPVLSPTGQQQVCTDSVLTLSTNVATANSIAWNTGTNARTLRVGTAGQYTARAISVFGCSSVASAPVSLTVQPRLATPAVGQVGVYTLRDTLADGSLAYDWRLGNQFITGQNSAEIKVTQTGAYTTRSKKVFTLAGSDLTCYSAFSNALDYVIADDDKGLTIYPNPSPSGQVSLEVRENLTNATLNIYTLHGQLVYTTTIPTFNSRRALDLSVLMPGQYIVQVRAAGFNAANRLIIE
ncbi:T9SS type A sorting domain-containing protein [Tellurirhabdus bombi]|uniref:T9SS type A sorting domain-containing protein n=1 Tax=Tellurirhabdus bombi TaxID=2907205 RepID=UPI001F29C856|nr:sialate O-acetylesterase [Tellurirhabdus bombi]